MRHGTSCTVLPDRDGEGMPSPYGGRIIDAVGRLAVPRPLRMGRSVLGL